MVFSGALVLTHDAAKLILIGGANIATAPGDVAEWLSLGGGNWRMTGYSRASGIPVGVVPLVNGGTGGTDAATARANLGLGSVNNTSDANKPISTATQNALDQKADANSTLAALSQKADASSVLTVAQLHAIALSF
jgi:hypothetical protein